VQFLGGNIANDTVTGYGTIQAPTVAGAIAGSSSARLQFATDSAKPVLRLFNSGGTLAIRIIVNGQFATLTPYTIPQVGWIHLIINFGSQVMRDVTVETGNGVYFGGVDVAATEGVYASVSSPTVTLIGVGDSIMSSAGTQYYQNGFFPILCDQMGASNCIDLGIGGTGYIATATSGTALSRLSDVTRVAAGQQNIIIWDENGNNDIPYGGAAIQAACITYLRALRAAVGPYVPIIETGVTASNNGGTSWAAGVAGENAKSACVSAVNDPLVFWMPSILANGGSMFTGTGTDQAPNGTGNSDIYINGLSLPHPNTLGHAFWARQWLESVRRLVLPVN
jgi:lysophospholipase L1-like esterase